MRIKKIIIGLLYIVTAFGFVFFATTHKSNYDISNVQITLIRKTDDRIQEFNASTVFHNTLVLSVYNGCSSPLDNMIGEFEIRRNGKVIFYNNYLSIPLNGLKSGESTEISFTIKTETMAGEGQSELWTANASDLDILFYCKEMKLVNHRTITGDPTVIRIKTGSSGNNNQNNQSSSNSTNSNGSSNQDASLSPIEIDHIKTHIIDNAGVLDNKFKNNIGKAYFDFYEESGIQLFFAIETGPIDEDTYLTRLLENAWEGIAFVYDMQEGVVTYMAQNTDLSDDELNAILDEICDANTYEDMVSCLLTRVKNYS